MHDRDDEKPLASYLKIDPVGKSTNRSTADLPIGEGINRRICLNAAKRLFDRAEEAHTQPRLLILYQRRAE